MTEDEERIYTWLMARWSLVMEDIHRQTDGAKAERDAVYASWLRQTAEAIKRGDHRR